MLHTYLCPSPLVEHRSLTTPRHHTLLGCSGHSGPVGPLLFQLCFSVSPPTVARLASLSLPLQVPGQGLACGAGCLLPEGVSDPAPLSPQYLLSHWFLCCWLPQIFILDLLLPLDFVDAPQTGVEECHDLLLHDLCCPPCLTSVKQVLTSQMFMSMTKAALALPILAVTSGSVPPCWSTMLPR